jgi:NitT/TauT family transport system permease protein
MSRLTTREIGIESVRARRTTAQGSPRRWAPRLRQVAASAGWWALSIGSVIAIWEAAAALQLINPVILPPPHLFIAEIMNQAQFLMPAVGVESSGANLALLTAILASLRRVLSGLLLAFVVALCTGSLAFYLNLFGKLALPTITLLAPIASVAWIPLAVIVFGIGDTAAIFVVFIGIVFTLTLATVNNMNNVE